MITKLNCRYSFEVLNFHCNDFGFVFGFGFGFGLGLGLGLGLESVYSNV